MTKLLAQAFAKASSLPDDVQDQLARELLEEIEWESKWDETLARTQDELDALARRSAEEYRGGKTKKMGMDDL